MDMLDTASDADFDIDDDDDEGTYSEDPRSVESHCLAYNLCEIAKTRHNLPDADAGLSVNLTATILDWLGTQTHRLTAEDSWIVLFKVFGAEGVALATERRPGCTLAALLDQAEEAFTDPPRSWRIDPAMADLPPSARIALDARGFPFKTMFGNPKATALALRMALTVGHEWMLDTWRVTSPRKHPVFAYWTASKALCLPDTPLSTAGMAIVLDALSNLDNGSAPQAVRRLLQEYRFDARLWAVLVGIAHQNGRDPLSSVKGSKALIGQSTDSITWLLKPEASAHAKLYRSARLAAMPTFERILGMPTPTPLAPIDLNAIFPQG